MAKPSKQEIDDFYKAWWIDTYATTLKRTPMGLAEFASDFYDMYCEKSEADKES